MFLEQQISKLELFLYHVKLNTGLMAAAMNSNINCQISAYPIPGSM